MKFSITVSDFQYAMRLVKGVVPSAGPLLETKGVLISVRGNRASFTAYSPQLLARATVNIEGSVDGEVVVDAGTLWGALSRFQPRNEKGFGTSDIMVSRSPKARKLTVSATTRYKGGTEAPHKRVFPLLNSEFFPVIPTPENSETTFSIPAPLLMEGIDSVAYAVSVDKSQFVFTGISVRLGDGILTLAATNGVCLAEHVVPVEYAGDPISLVLPSVFATKIAKSFFDTDLLEVSLANGTLFVSTSNLVLAGTLIGDEYPDYRKIMPDPTEFVEVDKHIFVDNLLNLAYQAPEVEDNRVSVSISSRALTLSCGGSTNSGLATDYTGEQAFDCDLQKLVMSVRNVPGDRLRLGISKVTEPLHFSSDTKSHSDASFVSILVPLSRK